MKRRIFLAGVVLLPVLARAQAPAASPPVRLRGTVEALDGAQLTVRTREGASQAVTLAPGFVVMAISKASVEDIASGKFIGTTTVGERDGALVALEVHIFPENLRGTGEGHYEWDLRPQSKMTNANVATVTRLGEDRILDVQYKGGAKKVLVPPGAVIVSYAPADRAIVKPGAPVFLVALRQPDGSLSAARVNVGVNGQLPPM